MKNGSGLENELLNLNATSVQMREMAACLFQWNWIDTTGGSFSTRIEESSSLFAITPTHSGFQRWVLTEGLVVLDQDLNRSVISSSQSHAHPSALVHAFIYKKMRAAGAIIHTHSPHSLAFACEQRTIEPYTLQSQILGNVPCLTSDVDTITNRSVQFLEESEIPMTSGVTGYQYAYDHFAPLLTQIADQILPRQNELQRHGLAFTVYKHGIFVVARSLNEAFDNLIRVERNAQVQLLNK